MGESNLQSAFNILDNFKLDVDSDLNTLLVVSVSISTTLGLLYFLERGFPKGRHLLMILSPCIAYLAIAVISYFFFFCSLIWAIAKFSC